MAKLVTFLREHDALCVINPEEQRDGAQIICSMGVFFQVKGKRQKEQSKMATRVKKKIFSSFTYTEAFKYLEIKKIHPWRFEVIPIEPSAFFHQRLRRMADVFDLQSYEESKKLIIDAVCEEVLQGFKYLKLWKGAPLADENTMEHVDYLMAERKAYLEAPFLCIVEAKKDDFE
ncbi:MAG: hypothetical protein Q6L60_13615 [Thermostichus sp. HHBFW_bins_43]